MPCTRSDPSALLPPPPVDRGRPGASAAAEHQRRHDQREARIGDRWGRLAGVVKFLTDDPQTTTAWATGADGERKAAAKLAELAGPHTEFLFDRKVPRTRGNIDLLAIAPSGVWVIDAKNLKGAIEHRNVGGLLRTDMRLYVGGRDKTSLVDAMGWQVDAVRRALGDDAVRVRAALCFVEAEWKKFFAEPFDVGPVNITGPRGLAARLREPGPLDPPSIEQILHRLSAALPAAAP